MDYKIAEKKIQEILLIHSKSKAMENVVNFLYEGFEKYSWVGIYLVNGNQLLLGPWRGEQATEHTVIPIGIGICGAAAKSGKTELVEDVSKDERYLSCFLSTRSEIVVPIKKMNVVIGEIDIDSDKPAAFNKSDILFLEKIANLLSNHI